MKGEVAVFWFRRDFRLEDNTGLFKALSSGFPVLPVFIFDTEILKELPPDDARVSFIHRQLCQINSLLQDRYASSLAFYCGKPVEVFQDLLRQWTINAVFTNRDYEPYAVKRDQDIKTLLATNGVSFHTFKDQVIFEKSEVVKGDGDPYVVYTPYMKKWKEVLGEIGRPETAASESHLEYLVSEKDLPFLSLEDIGFEESTISVPEYNLGESLIRNYEKTRNLPARDGTRRCAMEGAGARLPADRTGHRGETRRCLEPVDGRTVRRTNC